LTFRENLPFSKRCGTAGFQRQQCGRYEST